MQRSSHIRTYIPIYIYTTQDGGKRKFAARYTLERHILQQTSDDRGRGEYIGIHGL